MTILSSLFSPEWVATLDRREFDVLEATIDRELFGNQAVRRSLKSAVERTVKSIGPGKIEMPGKTVAAKKTRVTRKKRRKKAGK